MNHAGCCARAPPIYRVLPRRYSLDGSTPSIVYNAPFDLHGTTTIRAIKVGPDGTAAELLARNVTYVLEK